jgi:hypothetical protein
LDRQALEALWESTEYQQVEQAQQVAAAHSEHLSQPMVVMVVWVPVVEHQAQEGQAITERKTGKTP